MDTNLIAGFVALVGLLAIVVGVRLAGRASAAADARGLALGTHRPVRSSARAGRTATARPPVPRQVPVTGRDAG
jgi:hypothetical protein